MSNSESEINDNSCDFGSVLAAARKSQNYTVDQISRHLKIPAQLISAIEASDVSLLPPPTFAKGYIRAYARFLEISEESAVDLYNRAVPHNRVEKLKSRSNLPNEKNSQSPLIKTVTVFLIVVSIAALIYGGFQYYQKKANIMENQLETKERSFTGNSLDSPGLNTGDDSGDEPVTIEQNARLTDDDELILPQADNAASIAEEDEVIKPVDVSGPAEKSIVEPGIVESVPELEVEPVAEAETEAETEVGQEMSSDEGPQDRIEFFAEKGSWLEVRDANKKRLFYNMLPEGGGKVLHGKAPFYVSMGNARTTKAAINGLEIDMSAQIRPNNTARFNVSIEEEKVIFH